MSWHEQIKFLNLISVVSDTCFLGTFWITLFHFRKCQLPSNWGKYDGSSEYWYARSMSSDWQRVQVNKTHLTYFFLYFLHDQARDTNFIIFFFLTRHVTHVYDNQSMICFLAFFFKNNKNKVICFSCQIFVSCFGSLRSCLLSRPAFLDFSAL